MARDSKLYVRKAVVFAWKGYAPLVALVPAASIYPPQRPANVAWPFVGYGVPDARPFLASGMDGSTVEFAGHVYAETGGTGGATVDGETFAGQVAEQLVYALGQPLDLAARGCPWPATAHVTWTGTQVIQHEQEADRFHAIVGFRVDVSS